MNLRRRIRIRAREASNAVPDFILLMGLLALLVIVSIEHTYGTGRLGTIVFSSAPPPPLGEHGNQDIFVADRKFQNWIRLTNDPARDTLPCWSPDGTKIAFVSERDGDREIYIMDADGRNQTNITKNPTPDDDPSWSPDGRMIAFHSTRGGIRSIFVVDIDGKGLDMIVSRVVGCPAWSPDGKKIAYINLDGDIETCNTQGRNQSILTRGPGYDFNPSWSPDGQKIAFHSNRTGFWEIYTMNADGSDQKRLTNSKLSDLFPDWTSDGRIIWQRSRAIYIMDSDGENQEELSEGGATFPDWFVPGPGYCVEPNGELRITWGGVKNDLLSR